MTNEDIEQIIKKHYGYLLPGLMPCVQEIVAQAKVEAYEESAQAADEQVSYCESIALKTTTNERESVWRMGMDVAQIVSERIRALKEQTLRGLPKKL